MGEYIVMMKYIIAFAIAPLPTFAQTEIIAINVLIE